MANAGWGVETMAMEPTADAPEEEIMGVDYGDASVTGKSLIGTIPLFMGQMAHCLRMTQNSCLLPWWVIAF